MATKNNTRTIRLTDEMVELIDQQIGDTFTEKFESLVTKCVWELPEKERQLSGIQEQTEREKRRLRELMDSVYQFRRSIDTLNIRADQLGKLIETSINDLLV